MNPWTIIGWIILGIIFLCVLYCITALFVAVCQTIKEKYRKRHNEKE